MSQVVTKFTYWDSSKSSRGGYAGYIGLREGVELNDQDGVRHGLFSDYDTKISKEKVIKELDEYDGNVYGLIISLRRDDAESTGFQSIEEWRNLVCANIDMLSKISHIPVSRLKWYAAFHDERHHPHIHLLFHSSRPREGHISTIGINEFRKAVNEYVGQYNVEVVQDEDSALTMEETWDEVERIHNILESGSCSFDEDIEKDFEELALILQNSNQKYYVNVSKKAQAVIDKIYEKVADNPIVKDMYSLLTRQRKNEKRKYRKSFDEDIPIYKSREFRSLKNDIIQIVKNNRLKEKSTALIQHIYNVILSKIKLKNTERKEHIKQNVKTKIDSKYKNKGDFNNGI